MLADASLKPHGSVVTAASHIVLFSGGSACRNINIALSRMSARLTRIVPAWDSGGSSKVLREAFDMLPVGDVRQALMTMAHGEGRAGDLVKVCNARLSDVLGKHDALAEFAYYASGAHPLLARMEPTRRDTVLAYLGLFAERVPKGFDFRNGSIGNFILTGAYFAHGEDINHAVERFRDLCGIDGHVWAAATQPDIQLHATLKDGRRLDRQDLVTKMDAADSRIGVESIALMADDGVHANPETLAALATADIIVFAPGSFYTSILPHLLVEGVVAKIAQNRRAPRVFLGNILECAETYGMTLGEQVETFLGAAGADAPLLTHVVSNTELFPFEKAVGKYRYLRLGHLDAVCAANGIVHVSDDLEDAWTRGLHDGRAVATRLLELAAANTLPAIQ